MATKTCSKCKKEKPLSAFSVKKRSRDGLSYWCKDCANEYKKSYKQKPIIGSIIIKTVACMRCGKPVKFQVLKEYSDSYDTRRFCLDCKQNLRRNGGCFAD